MKEIDSPASLARVLSELFPAFSNDPAMEAHTYHQVVMYLSSSVTNYLEAAPARTVRNFCELINALVLAGGEKENAISTCLLEHASQIRLAPIIRPYLNEAARRELR